MVKKSTKPHVVIVGAGFGGLRAAQKLRHPDVDVTIVDQHNYHTFIPLLYQIATAGLEAEAIAQPVRRIIRSTNVRFQHAHVSGLDLKRKRVIIGQSEIAYDYLVLAAGSVTDYFGLDSVSGTTSALRDLDDAESTRSRILHAFENAAAEPDSERRADLMTIIVVGGGPTGVELAGAIAELRRHVLPHDFPNLDLSESRVVLLEAADHLLHGMHQSMQATSRENLELMGVEVRLGARVAHADSRSVTLADGDRIAAGAIVWVAGVRAPALAEALPDTKGAVGRVAVEQTLHLTDHPEVYVIGDMAHVGGPEAPPHPMLAPVAIQQGNLAAENILRHLAGKQLKRFKYSDRGTMVTIGRASAVVSIYGLRFSGFMAWVIWLAIHLVWLIGFRNRTVVLVNWVWNYFTYERGVRLIRDDREKDHGE